MTHWQHQAKRREFTAIPECQKKQLYPALCFCAFVAVHLSKNLVMLQRGVGKQAYYPHYAEETLVSEASSCHSDNRNNHKAEAQMFKIELKVDYQIFF